MTDRQWVVNIYETLSRISDEEYQRRAWFGLGPEVSSPGDEFNNLFDDYNVELFLARPPVKLSSQARKHLIALISAMNDVDEGYLYPSFIDDPRWIKIRKLALDAKMSLLRDIGS